ncbi:MAG TPA: LAGLIDADG family homing endonuclease [archaeon]|nr:LAGLIDADG family homing endonuclease [archaeon]
MITKEKAYLLGVMCGDGYLGIFNRKDRRFRVRLAVRDKDFAEEFARCLENEYDFKPCFYFYDSRWWVETSKSKVAQDLLKMGPFSRFSWKVSSNMFSEKTEIKCSFLRGFFDSEGFANDKMIGCCSANKEGLIQVVRLLESIGINPMVYLNAKSDGAYRLQINRMEERLKFCKLVGFSIRRKLKNLQNSLSGSVGN